MADKAAVEQQNLPYQRKLEKQAKVLEKLTESHRFVSNRMVSDSPTFDKVFLLIMTSERHGEKVHSSRDVVQRLEE